MRDRQASIEEQRHGQNAEGLCKTASDLDRYRRVIAASEPDGIIEIGSYNGHSAVWFAREARCPVLSIDVTHSQIDVSQAEAAALHITFHLGRSDSPITQDTARWWSIGKDRIMVTLDGDHSAPTVLREMNHYSTFVRPGGYMVVEDGIIRWVPEQWPHYDGGPLDAIEAWLPEHQDWEANAALEDLHPTTQFPSGWLLRR